MTVKNSKLITDIQALVRETGYHIARLQAEGHPKNEEYSRSYNLYNMAVALLRYVDDKDSADQFIKDTFSPIDLPRRRGPR